VPLEDNPNPEAKGDCHQEDQGGECSRSKSDGSHVQRAIEYVAGDESGVIVSDVEYDKSKDEENNIRCGKE
jgi:hypothetical protein